MRTKSKLAAAGLLLGSLFAFHAGGQTAPGPFAALAGSWSGAGNLTTSAGLRERLRCHAVYRVVDGDGDRLQLKLRCASTSHNFDLSGAVELRGGTLTGSWSEANRNASGTIAGEAKGDRILVAARGDTFSATLSLTTRGNRQELAIQSHGAEVTNVAITLNKG